MAIDPIDATRMTFLAFRMNSSLNDSIVRGLIMLVQYTAQLKKKIQFNARAEMILVLVL